MTTAVGPQARPGASEASRPADVLVVFGITGDLAKVMTFRSLYRLERRGLLDCPIVGVAVDDWTVDALRERARASIVGTGEPLDEGVFERLAGRLSYVSGDFGDAETFERVAAAISGAQSPVFYLEIPPFLFGTVIKGLADTGLTANARVVVEKPFGHDLTSARELNDQIHEHLDEAQLYRIDHFLGKMGLSEILYLRFANAMFEPIWNRNYVSCVELTVGDATRFTRQDSVEEAWRILQPPLEAPPPVHPYVKGSWGPDAAQQLVAGYGRWHGPWVVS